jgi:hypothetical protein
LPSPRSTPRTNYKGRGTPALTCLVIFAPADSLYLLGATALENFGVQADPTTQQLKPISAVIGGFLASVSRRG